MPRRSSGSSRAESAVEPTRSQNTTVSWRRSAVWWEGGSKAGARELALPRGANFCPHSAQKLAPPGLEAPHDWHCTGRPAPQAIQNLPVSGVSAWQEGHSTDYLLNLTSLAQKVPTLAVKARFGHLLDWLVVGRASVECNPG